MTLDSLIATLANDGIAFPLAGSLIAGLLIGAEREYSGKPAGLRTHALVCFASALMTLTGVRMAGWTISLPADTQIVSDLARMPHAILTGIGFLGAGVILREGATVRGLTTAASLWFTSALGITYGTGLLELAVIGTLAALLVLALLRVLNPVRPPRRSWQLDLSYPRGTPPPMALLQPALHRIGWSAAPPGISESESESRYSLTLSPVARRSAEHPALICDTLREQAPPLSFSLRALPPGTD